MTALNLTRERVDFEAAVRAINPTVLFLHTFEDGSYKHAAIESRWQGWQMAKRAALAQSPVSAEGLTDAQDTTEAVATEVLRHIDTMYPAMWTAVAKNARTSIRNTIINQSKRYVAAIAAADKGTTS